MGWAEEAARKAREVVDGSKGVPSAEPRPPVPGGAPSEFLESVVRGMMRDCMAGAAMVQSVLSPPPSIVGPGGQAPSRPDPMAVVLAMQLRLLHAQAATLDLLLTAFGCRPELRPMAPPNGNGDSPTQSPGSDGGPDRR